MRNGIWHTLWPMRSFKQNRYAVRAALDSVEAGSLKIQLVTYNQIPSISQWNGLYLIVTSLFPNRLLFIYYEFNALDKSKYHLDKLLQNQVN